MSRLPAIPPGIEVSSVGFVDSTGLFNVTNSPIVSQGNINLGLVTQAANEVLAGPTSGSPAVPTMRALVAADIPTISVSSGITGVLPAANGGTGVSTIAANEVLAGPTSGGAAAPAMRSLVTADIPAIPLTSGVSGVLPVANGGTGVNSVSANQVLAGPTSGGAAAPAMRGLVTADIPAIPLTSGVSGVLPVANGGTGASASLTSGSLLFASGGVVTQNNPYLFWSNSLLSMGLGGTTSPGQLLDLYNGHLRSTQIVGPGTFTTTAITGSGTLAAGTYKYAFTFVTDYGETAIGIAKTETLSATGKINLSALTPPPSTDNVRFYNIYRTIPGGTAFFLLTQITAVSSLSFDDDGHYTLGLVDYSFRDNTTAGRLYIGTTPAGYMGGSNTSFGRGTLASITGGIGNTLFGASAGNKIDTGIDNTLVGYQAGSAISSGKLNAIFGALAGLQITTGDQNVCFGCSSGGGTYPLLTGTGNTFLGSSTGFASGSQFNNTTAIGNGALVGASNTMALGGTGTFATKVVICGTTASAQLDVNAVDASTVGIIVDNSNASPTGDLQQWKVAGTTMAAIDKSGRMALNAPASSACQLLIKAVTASTTGLVIDNSNTSPTADLQQWQSGGTSVARIDNVGNLGINKRAVIGGSLTIVDSQLHVECATTTTIGLVVNGPASAAIDLQRWQVNGVVMASMDQTGSATIQDLNASGDATVTGQFSPNGAYVPGSVNVVHAASPYFVNVHGPSIIECNSTGGSITVNLPTSSLIAGQMITILDASGDAGTGGKKITVSAGGTIAINGSTIDLVSTNKYACLVLRCAVISSVFRWTIVSNIDFA